MDGAALTLIFTLAVAAIVMVFAMVQFSIAIVFAAGRPSAVRRWGLIYFLAWAAIVFVMVRGAVMSNAGWRQALAVAILVAGGWGTFHAFWVWLGLSLQRDNARTIFPGALGSSRWAALSPWCSPSPNSATRRSSST